MIKEIEKLIMKRFNRYGVQNLSDKELSIQFNTFFQRKLKEIEESIEQLKNKTF